MKKVTVRTPISGRLISERKARLLCIRMAGLHHARIFGLFALFLVSFANRVVALDPTSRISQYGHSVWRVQDGYFGAFPSAIAQTKDGYLWIGTDTGLFRFDGVRFTRWSAQSGEQLPSSRIRTLLARDGSLWIGTDAGLAHLVSNELTLYQKKEGWLIGGIIEDRDWQNLVHPFAA